MFRELQVPRSVGVKAIAALHEELTSWSAEDAAKVAAKVASESQLKEFMDLVKN
jgi:peptidyl-tRNA hydrolase